MKGKKKKKREKKVDNAAGYLAPNILNHKAYENNTCGPFRSGQST